jgi:hypothetical protein
VTYIYHKQVRNAPIRRRLDRRFVSWVLVSACVGTVVAAGFVYAARCHFEAVALGYQTQELKREIGRAAEQRRALEADRAAASSPEELEGRARRLGLRQPELPGGEAATPTMGVRP